MSYILLGQDRSIFVRPCLSVVLGVAMDFNTNFDF